MAAPEHMEITKMKHKGTRISDMRSWYYIPAPLF